MLQQAGLFIPSRCVACAEPVEGLPAGRLVGRIQATYFRDRTLGSTILYNFLSSVVITFLIAIATVAHLARKAARTNPVDVLSQE